MEDLPALQRRVFRAGPILFETLEAVSGYALEYCAGQQ
jgi:hypothetical protein